MAFELTPAREKELEKIEKEVKACISDTNYYESFFSDSNPFGNGSTSNQVADILARELS